MKWKLALFTVMCVGAAMPIASQPPPRRLDPQPHVQVLVTTETSDAWATNERKKLGVEPSLVPLLSHAYAAGNKAACPQVEPLWEETFMEYLMRGPDRLDALEAEVAALKAKDRAHDDKHRMYDLFVQWAEVDWMRNDH